MSSVGNPDSAIESSKREIATEQASYSFPRHKRFLPPSTSPLVIPSEPYQVSGFSDGDHEMDPSSPQWDLTPSPTSDSSLFGDPSSSWPGALDTRNPASRNPPPIPGLHFIPDLRLPISIQDELFEFCSSAYFSGANADVNQVMLFEKSPSIETSGCTSNSISGLPTQFHTLLSLLSDLLHPHVPSSVHSLLFPPTPILARQAIINSYESGEGITPHVDLLGRYADGIIGVSLGSGCVMRFAQAVPGSESAIDDKVVGDYGLYLPKGSIIAFSGEARYKWTHGIEKMNRDWVAREHGQENGAEGEWVERGRRISITLRWLLPGADVVGGLGDPSAAI